MTLIDTHCHLYHKDFDKDFEQVIERAKNNGIEKIFLPAIDSESHEKLIQVSAFKIQNSKFKIHPMMGLHPCSVKENFEDELKIAEGYLNDGRKYYAVGEIGLDYYWDITFKEQQILAFERQIEWAIERGLPIVIHSRQSTADCIKSVQKYAGKVTGIFHCFSGTVDEAKQIMELGLYLGIGGVVTYKKAGLKEALPEIGLSHLVLETDAPYLSPVPHRGKRNEPGYIKLIAETVADAFQKSVEEIATATTANALRVFKMND
jgi:TatD DNase family protein